MGSQLVAFSILSLLRVSKAYAKKERKYALRPYSGAYGGQDYMRAEFCACGYWHGSDRLSLLHHGAKSNKMRANSRLTGKPEVIIHMGRIVCRQTHYKTAPDHAQ